MTDGGKHYGCPLDCDDWFETWDEYVTHLSTRHDRQDTCARCSVNAHLGPALASAVRERLGDETVVFCSLDCALAGPK